MNRSKETRLNYNGRVHMTHIGDIPRVPSSGAEGDCASGSHRAPATEGYLTKSGSHSRSN